MQMRARADRRGVAGKPTTTMAMPRSNSSREVEEILPGLNSMTGCMNTEQLTTHCLVCNTEKADTSQAQKAVQRASLGCTGASVKHTGGAEGCVNKQCNDTGAVLSESCKAVTYS